MSYPTEAAYPESSQATTALVLAILGIICCGPLAIVGWVIANNELAGIAAGRRTPSNEGTAKAARIVGIIGTVLWGIGIIVGAALTIGGSLDFPFTT
jgi:hypothetical protein